MSDPVTLNFGTTAGIVGASFVITEVIKAWTTPKTPILSKIPVILVPIALCAGLTLLANKVMHRDDGSPWLVGNIWTLLGQSIGSAASTSGIYTWLTKGNTNIGDSKPITDATNGNEDRTMTPNP